MRSSEVNYVFRCEMISMLQFLLSLQIICTIHVFSRALLMCKNIRVRKMSMVVNIQYRLMLLSQCGEYSCEYEYWKFAVNSSKNCDWIVNIFISVVPRPPLTNILRIYYECVPTLANVLQIANERCEPR
ncbi:hypothetical protein GQR58_014888 [Nymphon striatum]|nr:hypothetical protein GQR58_014888 [Nymphon striatum]